MKFDIMEDKGWFGLRQELVFLEITDERDYIIFGYTPLVEYLDKYLRSINL